MNRREVLQSALGAAAGLHSVFTTSAGAAIPSGPDDPRSPGGRILDFSTRSGFERRIAADDQFRRFILENVDRVDFAAWDDGWPETPSTYRVTDEPADDDPFQIALAPGAVWLRLAPREFIHAAAVGLKCDGSDEGVLLNALLKTANVMLPANKTLGTSRQVTVPDGRRLEGANNTARILALADINGFQRNHPHLVVARSRTHVGNLILDGANRRASGIAWASANDWTASKISVRNTGSAKSELISAVAATHASNGKLDAISVSRAWHGITIWQCSNIAVAGSTVDKARGGGIWTADSNRITVTGGKITNCGDVGLDFEGGTDCTGDGVTVESCRNGELAVFRNGVRPQNGSRNLRFLRCTVKRTPTYLDIDGNTVRCDLNFGSFAVHSADKGARGIAVDSCVFTVLAGHTWTTHDVPAGRMANEDAEIAFRNCDVRHTGGSGLFKVHQTARGFRHLNNTYSVTGQLKNFSVWKNAARSQFEGNTFIFSEVPAIGSVIFTSNNAEETGQIVKKNTWKGAGRNAIIIDYHADGQATFQENEFAPDGAFKGGIDFRKGLPIWVKQTLRVTMTGDRISRQGDYQNVNLRNWADFPWVFASSSDKLRHPSFVGAIKLTGPKGTATFPVKGTPTGPSRSIVFNVDNKSNGAYSVLRVVEVSTDFAKPRNTALEVLATLTLDTVY